MNLIIKKNIFLLKNFENFDNKRIVDKVLKLNSNAYKY